MISPRQMDVLEAIARFGYLTAGQILGLGIYSDRASLYDALRALGRQGLISSTQPQPKPGAGRFPGVYALAKAGAVLIGDLEGRLVVPLRGAVRGSPPLDIEHRTAIVDVHLSMAAWVKAQGHTLTRFTPDFAPSGQRGRRATAISTPYGDYTPDALAVLDCADGIRRPCVIEVYRGGMSGRASYLLRKLPKDLVSFYTDEVAEALDGRGSAARLLVVVEGAHLRDEVLAKRPEPDLFGWQFTLIKTLEELSAFGEDWWGPDGQKYALVPTARLEHYVA